ncbi:coiled-coil domain-containing protein 40 isoform X2 [Xyrichtys novacula]|uniref:Coiled-coil domain-containing protein 40 isoform X2 n=2 Tax=Xyrichtys novacula TaxID=13765 RepID=A0AAV1EWS1_XYRNO|nr:coiled-coil domain-containing protein 40 isoform X2 [Xyrichtys novacula]
MESDKASGNSGATVTPQPSQDQPGPELDASSAQPRSDQSVQEDVFQASPYIPCTSDLQRSEDMEDHNPLPEEEEGGNLPTLDPEHPLVIQYQAAVREKLLKELESVNKSLEEKRAYSKASDKKLQEQSVELDMLKKQLAISKAGLEEDCKAKSESEAKRRQSQAKLEDARREFTRTKRRHDEKKAKVAQLEAELDKLMKQVTFIKGLSKDLRSDVKVKKNARKKAGHRKNQAEEQKLQQDMYVERLTKDLEKVKQQSAMYEAQATAQVEKKETIKQALSEAEMQIESLAMTRKELLQQCNSSLTGLRKREEAYSAMQGAMGTVTAQEVLLDREIEGYKKSISKERERNETLITQLNWTQTKVTTSEKQISQRQAQQEALHQHYTTCSRSLGDTEHTLAVLSEESSTYQAQVDDQRKQLEKERAVRLELEDKIKKHMMQELTHNKAAKESQRLTIKMTALKKEKISQLWQLERNIGAVELENNKVSQHLGSLAVIQKDFDDQISEKTKLLAANERKRSSFFTLIERQGTIKANYYKQIHQITARTGHGDLSPMEIKIRALMAETEEVAAKIQSVQQLLLTRMGTVVILNKEKEANSRDIAKLQIEFIDIQQKTIYLESQTEAERHDETELEKNTKLLRRDLLKLDTQLFENERLSKALKQENALTEKDFMRRLKEAEQESAEMQMKHERILKEKERLLSCLLEADQQIMLWERKIQLLKETRSVVDAEMYHGDIRTMKAEIRQKKLRINQLTKRQGQLVRESEALVERRAALMERCKAMSNSPKKTTRNSNPLVNQRLQRKIKDAHKREAKCEEMIRDLQESQVSLKDRLLQQEQRLIDLRSTNSMLDHEIVNLRDTKDSNLSHLVTLQSRSKRLQEVSKGSYRAMSTPESIESSLQKQMERLHTTNAILHRVCQEFPQHQEKLRKILSALASRLQALEQKTL